MLIPKDGMNWARNFTCPVLELNSKVLQNNKNLFVACHGTGFEHFFLHTSVWLQGFTFRQIIAEQKPEWLWSKTPCLWVLHKFKLWEHWVLFTIDSQHNLEVKTPKRSHSPTDIFLM